MKVVPILNRLFWVMAVIGVVSLRSVVDALFSLPTPAIVNDSVALADKRELSSKSAHRRTSTAKGAGNGLNSQAEAGLDRTEESEKANTQTVDSIEIEKFQFEQSQQEQAIKEAEAYQESLKWPTDGESVEGKTELEWTNIKLQQLQQEQAKQEDAYYEDSLRSQVTPKSEANLTELELTERELQQLQLEQAEREAAAYAESQESL
jgi:hypothetical protein